jgi:hypothetical protein
MPEASVDEDRPFPLTVRQVRRSGQISVLSPKADAFMPQQRSERQLRLGVALTYAPHSSGRCGIGFEN